MFPSKLMTRSTKPLRSRLAVAGALGLVLVGQPASAELLLSQLVVDLNAAKRTTDIEIRNDSKERQFVAVEPSEIVDAGKAAERRARVTDPQAAGLLVAPGRMVLEPGQRRLIRVARVGAPAQAERVYRIAVKPVVGDVEGQASGLKLLVGYDMLVLARPAVVDNPPLRTERRGDSLVVTNPGNASVELSNGEHCVSAQSCKALAGKRIYAGASWSVMVPAGGEVRYKVRTSGGWTTFKN